MDESNRNPLPAPGETPGTVRKPVRFAGKDWLSLLFALVFSLLFFYVFSLERMAGGGMPGLGITVFVFAIFGAVFLCAGRHARPETADRLIFAATVLLSLTFCLFGDMTLTVLNCFFVLGLGAMSIFRLSGLMEKSWRQAGVLWETFSLSVLSLFTHVDKPFRALSGLNTGGRKHLAGAALGLLVAVPLLTLVLMLLTSADAVFRGLLMGFGDWLASIGAGRLLWQAVRTAALALLLFSALYSLRQPRREKAGALPAAHPEKPSMPYIVVLTLLDFVYLVFVAIQFAYLFGGAEAAAMKGGWAEYARGGFFQLVGISVINLAAVLAAAPGAAKAKKAAPERRVLLALAVLLLLLTAVILCSAAWRMWLYISVYGLSLLRALTLWGMALAAISLAAALLRLFLPGFRFFPVFFAAGLSLWLVFSFINIDRRIADYNVDAWLSGRVEQIDTDYLTRLGPDTMPALRRLNRSDPGAFSDSELRAFEEKLRVGCEDMTWREWNLSLLRAG